jgi:hypothetical protein
VEGVHPPFPSERDRIKTPLVGAGSWSERKIRLVIVAETGGRKSRSQRCQTEKPMGKLGIGLVAISIAVLIGLSVWLIAL